MASDIHSTTSGISPRSARPVHTAVETHGAPEVLLPHRLGEPDLRREVRASVTSSIPRHERSALHVLAEVSSSTAKTRPGSPTAVRARWPPRTSVGEDRAELLVVHRGDLLLGLLGDLEPALHVSRRGRHEQPPFSTDRSSCPGSSRSPWQPSPRRGAPHLRWPGRSWHPDPPTPPRSRRRLVGREHDARTRCGKEGRDLPGISRDREAQFGRVGDERSSSRTVSSEQTGSTSNGRVAFALHSRSVWASRDSDGTRTSVRWTPFFRQPESDKGLARAARHDEAARSSSLKPRTTASIAPL